MITSETPSVDIAPGHRLSVRAAIKDRISGLTGVRRLQPEEPMNLARSIRTNVVEIGGDRQIQREKGVVQIVLNQVRSSGVRFNHTQPDQGTRHVRNTGTEPIHVLYPSGKTDTIPPKGFHVTSSQPLRIAWDTPDNRRVTVDFTEVWYTERNFEDPQMSYRVTSNPRSR